MLISRGDISSRGGERVKNGLAVISYAKPSRQSNKERATDKPSWVSQADINPNKSAQQNASDLLNAKYGKGNWKRGPATEYNQIVKWVNRCLRVMIIPLIDILEDE